MNKKIWIPLIILGLIFTLGACGNDSKPYNYDLTKYVTVAEYKNLELVREEIKVTQEDLDLAIGGILAAAAKENIEKITTGIAKDGDKVNIDYNGTLDGVAFENGSAKASDLILGSGKMTEGFEAQIIGKPIGSTFMIDISFPQEYHVEQLKGKDVQFEITINYKEGELVMPKFDENFVKSTSKHSTIKEYMDEVEKNVYEQKEGQEKVRLQTKIWEQIMETSEVIKYPKEDMKRITERVHEKYQPYADYYKIEFPEVINTIFGMTEEQLIESICEEEMVLYTIARNENIEVSKEEYDKGLLEMLEKEGFASMEQFEAAYGQSYEKGVGKENVIINLLREKVINWLIEVNTAS